MRNISGDTSSHERIIAGSRHKRKYDQRIRSAKNNRKERFLSKRKREREGRKENAVRGHENEHSENAHV